MTTLAEYLKLCKWPDLQAPYDLALQQAVRFILEYVPDVRGILASGTILRGNPAPSSDLDLYVIRHKQQRQRLQRCYNGVPTEIFINPLNMVYAYLAEERQVARPITAHMIHTGFTILALDDSLSALKQLAAQELSRTSDPTPQQLTTARYMAATRYEDATDIADTRPETATMILGQAVYAMLHYAFLKANRYIPRDKDLLVMLEELDTTLAHKAMAFYSSPSLEDRLALAQEIADRTIQTRGFFAWESEPEDVTSAPSED
jgi:HEPN domain-containing protein